MLCELDLSIFNGFGEINIFGFNDGDAYAK